MTSDDPAVGLVTVDSAAFLAALGDLGLAEPDELGHLQTPDAAGDDPSRLARILVRTGRITPYQAGAILQGKARGLAIGSYVVQDKVGMGGMGMVFRARHRGSGRVVALKMLPPSFGRDPDAVRRFRREFQVASQLSHPNLVPAIEASMDRGVHFLTMEFIRGQNLESLVRQGGPMDVRLALHCAVQTARGLEAAHAQGVVHRDIKPGNLMIDAAGLLRVLDLGLARVIEAASALGRSAADTLTQTGAYMGTVDFLPPEQANDAKRADARSDVYALGCTLFYLLTGRTPYRGDTILQRLMAHQAEPVPSVRALRPEVPEPLDAAVRHMMAKRPEDRPQTISDVIHTLESCRATPREAGDVSADLKTFARTAMSPSRPTVFSLPEPTQPLPLLPIANAPETIQPLVTIDPDDLDPRLTSPAPMSPASHRRNVVIRGVLAAGLVLLASLVAWAWVGTNPRPSAPQLTAQMPEAAVTLPLAPPAVAAEEDPTPPEPEPEPAVPVAPATLDTPVPPPAPPAAPEAASHVLVADDFGGARALWPAPTPEEVAADKFQGWGYTSDGFLYYGIKTADGLQYSWPWTAPPIVEPFELRTRMRIVAGAPGAWGVATLHLFTDFDRRERATDPRAVVIRIGTDGRLEVSPSFWTAAKYPDGPWTRPIAHPVIRGEGSWNDLAIRVRHREMEVRVNGELVTGVLPFDWELLPVKLSFGVESNPGPVRAEIESLKVVRLEGEAARVVGVSPPGRLIAADTFENPASGWGEEEFDGGPNAVPNRRGYMPGAYFLELNSTWWGTRSWNATSAPVATPYEIRVVGRVVGDGSPAGGWGICIMRADGKGVRVGIDRSGRLSVEPAQDGHPRMPNARDLLAPTKVDGLRSPDVWNVLSVRLEARRLTVLVNGRAVGPPIQLDGNLLPSTPRIAVFKPELGTRIRAEFDDVAVRVSEAGP
jgi:serine/threonine protein kinase